MRFIKYSLNFHCVCLGGEIIDDGFFIIFTSRPDTNRGNKKKYMIHISSFSELTREIGKKKRGLIIIEFSASWCIPCKNIAEQVQQVALSHPNVTFISADVDEVEDIAELYNIEAMPTFVFIEKNNDTWTELGRVRGTNVEKLKEQVDKRSREVYGILI